MTKTTLEILKNISELAKATPMSTQVPTQGNLNHQVSAVSDLNPMSGMHNGFQPQNSIYNQPSWPMQPGALMSPPPVPALTNNSVTTESALILDPIIAQKYDALFGLKEKDSTILLVEFQKLIYNLFPESIHLNWNKKNTFLPKELVMMTFFAPHLFTSDTNVKRVRHSELEAMAFNVRKQFFKEHQALLKRFIAVYYGACCHYPHSIELILHKFENGMKNLLGSASKREHVFRNYIKKNESDKDKPSQTLASAYKRIINAILVQIRDQMNTAIFDLTMLDQRLQHCLYPTTQYHLNNFIKNYYTINHIIIESKTVEAPKNVSTNLSSEPAAGEEALVTSKVSTPATESLKTNLHTAIILDLKPDNE